MKVHIPTAAMAYLCSHSPQPEEGEGEVCLKGKVQTVRGVRYVNAGGFGSQYTPPCFSDVEPYRLHLLQQLQNGRGLDRDIWFDRATPVRFYQDQPVAPSSR